MTRKYFGTDGIRGRVGEPPITPEFILKLGWAVGKVLGESERGRILIGKDTRISGYMFESLLEAGLVAAGVDVALLGPMPTPAVAYLTRTFSARAGIVISASHNPYDDNGIKFFDPTGRKLDDAVEEQIENLLQQDIASVDSAALGKVVRIDDAAGRYIEHCKNTVPAGFSLHGLKLVVDCAHGATYHVAPYVFRELGAQVSELGTRPDGLNINADVGSTSPAALQQQVLSENADLGIAFDGDGDRVVLVDHRGELIDGDGLLYLIAAGKQAAGESPGGVVGTVMSNLGLERAINDLELPFARAAVGDRHVLAEMRQRKWQLGGESSGHIICADVSTTGDGIVAALQVLLQAQRLGRSVADLVGVMQRLPQVMINVRTDRALDLKNSAEISQAIVAAEQKLGDRGRVLLRASGTEPVIRVMVEGESQAQIETLAAELAQAVRKQADQLVSTHGVG